VFVAALADSGQDGGWLRSGSGGRGTSPRSVTTCRHHGQVRQTSGGLISVGGRRRDEHHRVIVNIAGDFGQTHRWPDIHPERRSVFIHSG